MHVKKFMRILKQKIQTGDFFSTKKNYNILDVFFNNKFLGNQEFLNFNKSDTLGLLGYQASEKKKTKQNYQHSNPRMITVERTL
jgi:hypothetical protein